MITWTLLQNAARIAAENPLVARLTLVSIELALLAVGVALLIRLLRVRAPRLKALLWLLVLAKPILGLAIGTPMPLIHFQQPAVAEAVSSDVATGAAELDALVARQLEADRERLAALPAGAILSASSKEASANKDRSLLQAATSMKTRRSIPISSLLMGLWLAGVLGFVGLTIYNQIRIRKLRVSASAPPDELMARFHALAKEMKLKTVPRLRLTEALESPALIGLLRPDVFLPRWLANEAESSRLDWLLRHELMHWKLNDPVALVVRRLAEIMFYFHPAVWWAGRKWEEAMELACDRAMIQNEDEAHSYAQNLYEVLTHLKEVKTMKCSNGLFATRTQIGKRIAALLSNPFRSPARLSAFSVTGLAVVALFSLAIGLGFNKTSTAQGTQPLEVTQSAEPEKTALTGVLPKTPDNSLGVSEEVQKKFVKTMQASVLIGMGVAAYHADHNQAPAHAHNLTTPIAYLTKIPDDPFSTGPMHIVRDPKESWALTVYSVGPDGDSDEGKPFDPDDPFLDGDIRFSIMGAGIIMPTGKGIKAVYEAYFLDEEENEENLKHMPEAGPKVRALLEQALIPEAKIPSRVSRTKTDLRSLQTGMEAYHLDYETYPDVMHSLTTPLAYMTSYMRDTFADAIPPATEEAPAQPTPEPGPAYIRHVITPDYSAIHLYSVGPDGIDQRGELVYDPTNGTVSPGDIMRSFKLERYYRIKDPALQKKVKDQFEQLDPLKIAVEAWYLEHRALPDSLEKLMAPVAYIKSIPEDVFVPGGPISYYLDKEKGLATIYSYGPDGDDDAGEKDLRGRFGVNEIPDADIAVQISLSELQKRFSQKVTAATAEDDLMLQALLKLKERDGRDNALIHYQFASKLMPGLPRGEQRDLIKQVREQGWSEEANVLLPYIATFQPTFEQIRKGAALDYAMGIGWDQGPATPISNFLVAMVSAKMLCVEGRYLESQGEYQKALDNYMTALTMGRDYSAPRSNLISYLISIAIESRTLQQIHHLATSGNLDRTTLDYVLKRLKLIEETQGMLADAFRTEANCTIWAIRKFREEPEKEEFFKGLSPEQTKALVDRLEADHKRLWDFEIQFLETPYWQRDPEAHRQKREEILASFHPLMGVFVPSVTQADARALVTKSKLFETQLATALAAYKMDKKRYPKRLSELVPDYLKALPTDPFNGEQFGYKLAPDGNTYMLYGVGPDRKDEATAVVYDPTNGTLSGGDIFFK